ncbi:N-acetylmuramoyl-L-alanine amidase [Odoribacter lunatus]|uniref:N-acetylmuramoyl-L-alanine amidase n=1 Tax=Odoribacter lunatus TaxID=2941335 RepID=UPI00204036EE|nr:N-acetylmuramoyl-L-alanine amidase [Odoribacter lunatus]
MIQETFPMIVGEEEVLNERELLGKVENGPMMNGADSVRFIVIHCSATHADCDYTVEQMLRDHKTRGFRTIGYHFYIRRNGIVTRHRGLLEVGAHARGYNRCSIGICYEGGLNADGKTADTRTQEQKTALLELLWKLHKLFPQAIITGHCELPGTTKTCPGFYPSHEYVF